MDEGKEKRSEYPYGTWKAHGCMAAGGKATQETKPRSRCRVYIE